MTDLDTLLDQAREWQRGLTDDGAPELISTDYFGVSVKEVLEVRDGLVAAIVELRSEVAKVTAERDALWAKLAEVETKLTDFAKRLEIALANRGL